jgi:hypothetical protein
MKPLFKNLIQVGMVVKDLQKSMEKCIDYGIGPMYVLEFNPGCVSEMHLYGKKKDYAMNVGVCPIEDVRYELIEPITESIYSDYLDKCGEGIIHHLKLGVDNYYEAIEYMESIGIQIIQSGHQLGDRGKNMYTYLDTSESLGYILEITNVEKDFIKPKPDRWFPENKKMISDPVFIRPKNIGVVVKDLPGKIEQYSGLFGLESWTIKEFYKKNVNDMYIDGKKKDYSVKMGFYTLGNTQLKLIEPQDESIFSDFYDKYGEGIIHHLGVEVNDYNRALDLLQSKGVEIIQSGIYSGEIKYSYISTSSDLNFIMEITESGSRGLLP